jgi:hypothetical protein
LAHSSGGELPIYYLRKFRKKEKKKTSDETSLFSGAKISHCFENFLSKII